MVQTIDSTKIAESLNSAWGKLDKEEKLRCLIQINTSQEEG